MSHDTVVKQSVLYQAANDFGFATIEEMFASATFNCVSPAICPRCGATEELEPDGTCPCECGGTITSVLLLAGMI